MTSELQLDFDIDAETQINRLAEILCEQHPPARIRAIEEVLIADGGPVDYLGWLVLDDYQDHCFFYNDENPDQETLRWLLSISPRQSELPQLKHVLRQTYDEYAEGDHGAVIEIPDAYVPGRAPKATVAFYHNPLDSNINAGTNTTPASRQEEILNDIEKLIPARDLETFVLNSVRTLRTELHEEANRHLLEGDVSAVLEEDPHFRQETVTDVPVGIHPEYTEIEAELWQKPVSRVDSLSGAQGFVQVWIPDVEEQIALVSLTRGEFDHDKAVDTVRSSFTEMLS